MEVLILDLAEGDKGEAAPPRVRLVVRGYPSDAKGFVSLTPECDTIEGLEQAMAELKKNMESLLRRAREKFQMHLVQADGETAVANFDSTEEIWRTLEQCASIEEMRESFNSLGRQKRQEVADFVLTQLNIFKGAASTFSQHYNEAEHCLE
jgi:hypothetical protein